MTVTDARRATSTTVLCMCICNIFLWVHYCYYTALDWSHFHSLPAVRARVYHAACTKRGTENFPTGKSEKLKVVWLFKMHQGDILTKSSRRKKRNCVHFSQLSCSLISKC